MYEQYFGLAIAIFGLIAFLASVAVSQRSAGILSGLLTAVSFAVMFFGLATMLGAAPRLRPFECRRTSPVISCSEI